MKKVVSLLVAAALALSLCCLTAFAEDPAPVTDPAPAPDVVPLLPEIPQDAAGVEGAIIPGATPDPASLPAYVLNEMREKAAERLNAADFFRGTDKGMELDRSPNRAEAGAALVRMLGAEAKATAENSDHPFADVKAQAVWANPTVGYLYKNNLTKGVSDTSFGCKDLVTAKQFYTFALRALGYKDDVDFTYDTAVVKAGDLGVISPELCETMKAATAFTRGDMAVAMFYTLTAKKSGSDKLLVDVLAEEGGITAAQAAALKGVADPGAGEPAPDATPAPGDDAPAGTESGAQPN